MPTTDDNVGCLFAIFRVLGLMPGKKPQTSEALPYRIRDDFLSPAEQSFFGVLTQILPPEIVVFSKVNVADILFVQSSSQRQSYVNRIDRKHVDFVLCNRIGFRPVAAVELDDASHQRPDRIARDQFIDQVFKAAGLPLIHVPAKRAYNVEELRNTFSQYLVGVPPVQVQQAPTATEPVCKKCGIPMVLRTSSKGSNQGGHSLAVGISRNAAKLSPCHDRHRSIPDHVPDNGRFGEKTRRDRPRY